MAAHEEVALHRLNVLTMSQPDRTLIKSNILGDSRASWETELKTLVNYPEGASGWNYDNYTHHPLSTEQAARLVGLMVDPQSSHADFINYRQNLTPAQLAELVLRNGIEPFVYGPNTAESRHMGPRSLERVIQGTRARYSLVEYLQFCCDPAAVSHLGRFLLFQRNHPYHGTLAETYEYFITTLPKVELYRAMALTPAEAETVMQTGIVSTFKQHFEQESQPDTDHSEYMASWALRSVNQRIFKHAVRADTFTNLISFSPLAEMAKYASRYAIEEAVKENPAKIPYMFKIYMPSEAIISSNTVYVPSPIHADRRKINRLYYRNNKSGEMIPSSSSRVESWVEFKTPDNAQIQAVEEGFSLEGLSGLFSEYLNGEPYIRPKFTY